jgi:glycerophosphoryl diester phosphodiesterase
VRILFAALVVMVAGCGAHRTTTDTPPATVSAREPVPAGVRPALLARAILPADAYQPGPPSGAAIAADNGVTPPFPAQPIPGFSAVLRANDGIFWKPEAGTGRITSGSSQR